MSDVLKAKAIWQIEGFLSLDERDQNTTFIQRNTFIGVDSDVGKVLMGRYDTPFKCLVGKIYQFNDRIGDAANITGTGGRGWDQRPDNTIAYQSPAMLGFTLTGAYGAEEEKDGTEMVSGSALWELEGVFIGAGYERHGKMLTGTDTNSDTIADIPSSHAEEGYRAIAGYSHKLGSVAGVFQKLSNVAGKSPTDSTVVGGAATFNIGKETVKAQYLVRDDSGPTAGATMFAVGVDHNFNKQMTAYIVYAAVNNESTSSYSMSGDGHADKVTPARARTRPASESVSSTDSNPVTT